MKMFFSKFNKNKQKQEAPTFHQGGNYPGRKGTNQGMEEATDDLRVEALDHQYNVQPSHHSIQGQYDSQIPFSSKNAQPNDIGSLVQVTRQEFEYQSNFPGYQKLMHQINEAQYSSQGGQASANSGQPASFYQKITKGFGDIPLSPTPQTKNPKLHSVSNSLAQSNSGNQFKGYRAQPQQKSPMRVPDSKPKMQGENKYKQFMKIEDASQEDTILKKHRNQHLPKIKTHDFESAKINDIDKRGTMAPSSNIKLEIPKAERNKSTSLKMGGVQQLIQSQTPQAMQAFQNTQSLIKEDTLTPLKKNLKTIGGGTPVGIINELQAFSDAQLPQPNEDSIYKMMNEPYSDKLKQPNEIIKKQKFVQSSTVTPNKKPPQNSISKADVTNSVEALKTNSEAERAHAWGQYNAMLNEEEYLLVNKKQIGQRFQRKQIVESQQSQNPQSHRQNKHEEEKILKAVRNSHSQFSRQKPTPMNTSQPPTFKRQINTKLSKIGAPQTTLEPESQSNSINQNNDSTSQIPKPGSASKKAVRIRSGRPVIKPRKESAISTTNISRKGKLLSIQTVQGSHEYDQSKEHHNNVYENLDSLDKSHISEQFPKNIKIKPAPNSALDINPQNKLKEDEDEEVPKRQQTFDIRHHQNILNEIIEEEKKETSTLPSPENSYKPPQVVSLKQSEGVYDHGIPNITLHLTPSAQTIKETDSNENFNNIISTSAVPSPQIISQRETLQAPAPTLNQQKLSQEITERQTSDMLNEFEAANRMSSMGSVADDFQRIGSNGSDNTTQFWASGKSELLRKFESPAQTFIRQQQKQLLKGPQEAYGTSTQIQKTLSGNESFYDSIKESLVDPEFTLRLEQTNAQNQQSNSNSGGDKDNTHKKSSSSGESHKSVGKQPTQQRMSQSSVGKSSGSSNSVLQASPDINRAVQAPMTNFGLQQQFQNPQQIKQFIAQNQQAILSHFSPPRSQIAPQPNTAVKVEPQKVVPEIQGSLIKWRQGPMIGKGQYGDVYLAMDVDTQRQFAVKKMNLFTPNNSYDQESIKQLKSEIDILKTIDDNRIVKYIGSEIIVDQFCIYLEYMPGGSIQKVYRDFSGHLEEREIKKYTKQIVEALVFLHDRKIAHLDLKGANILLDIEGQVKLSDFGCAAKIQGSLSQSEITGAIKGSIPWMAPEVIKLGKYRVEADIWSLGCTIIEMAVGGNPWGKEGFVNHFQAIVQIAESAQIPPIPGELSEECKDFISKCLQKDFSKRVKAKQLLQHPFIA